MYNSRQQQTQKKQQQQQAQEQQDQRMALIEQWAGAAQSAKHAAVERPSSSSSTPPPLSPSSPRATKLCCCPQRKRYQLKPQQQQQQQQQQQLQLLAYTTTTTTTTTAARDTPTRNIFFDNDFTFIDDVPGDGNSNSNSSNSQQRNNSNIKSNSDSNSIDSGNHSCLGMPNDCDNDNDNDNDDNDYVDDHLAAQYEQQQQQQQQQQENNILAEQQIQRLSINEGEQQFSDKENIVVRGAANNYSNKIEPKIMTMEAATMLPPAPPTRMKTVIKTTLVKRCPVSESSVAIADKSSNSCRQLDDDESPRRSVKERIAAFSLAGNVGLSNGNSNYDSQKQQQQQQTKNRERLPPCSRNSKFVDEMQQKFDNCATKTISNTTTTAATTTAASVLSNGCATMPRTHAKCNGGSAQLQAASVAAVAAGDKDASIEQCLEHKYATLDNLDLARNLDLIGIDDDGEDPYCVLQEYLERVKHEINEVFELRKAQRLEQERETLRQLQASQVMQEDRDVEDTDLAAIGLRAPAKPPIPAKHSLLEQERHSLQPATTQTQTPTPTRTYRLKALPPPPLPNSEEVNLWANKFLRDLDNLMGSTTPASSPTRRTSPMLLSAAARAAVQSRYGRTVTGEEQPTAALNLKPQKHATIPLQAFNFDSERNRTTKHAHARTLSAPDDCINKAESLLARRHKPATNMQRTVDDDDGNIADDSNNINDDDEDDTSMILKIEEKFGESAACRQEEQEQERLDETRRASDAYNEPATMHNATSPPAGMPKRERERINHATTTSPILRRNLVAAVPPATLYAYNQHNNQMTSAKQRNSNSNSNITAGNGNACLMLLNGNNGSSNSNNSAELTKKGSTSTIWTSEESILRSVGAADEDNNSSASASASSSSSASCEEATGILSSGKSGISLDWSGHDNEDDEDDIEDDDDDDDDDDDNENNESGIGTATPPKQRLSSAYWKTRHHHQQHHKPHAAACHDNESVSSLEALRKIKFHKCSSLGSSSDDPDLLEVLSLCDEPQANHGDAIDVVVAEQPPNALACSKCRSHSLSLTPTHQGHREQHQHHQQQQQQAVLQLPNAKLNEQRLLRLQQEPFQLQELPSPSSASLHSGHDLPGIQELSVKSNSAPLLQRQDAKLSEFTGQQVNLRRNYHSQSDRSMAEIKAADACNWLRAAGFPQYAQMYQDGGFPIDLKSVAKDHPNLDNDQLQALYRRLDALNCYENMRGEVSQALQTPDAKDDSDDEQVALSKNWTFQPNIRRWSRVGAMGTELVLPPARVEVEKAESSSKESSPERFGEEVAGALSLLVMLPSSSSNKDTDTSVHESGDSTADVNMRRSGSERIKDGAKTFLRRIESISTRRLKRQNRDGVVISGPHLLDLTQLTHHQQHQQQRSSSAGHSIGRKPIAIYSTPPTPSAVSPVHSFPEGNFFRDELSTQIDSENLLSPNRRTPSTPRSMRTSPLHFTAAAMPLQQLKAGKLDDSTSSSYYSDSQESAGGKQQQALRKAPSRTRRFLQRTGKVDDIGTHSDSECHQQGRKLQLKDASSANTTMVTAGSSSAPANKKLTRGGSLNLGKEPKKREPGGSRATSFRSRSSARKHEDAPKAGSNVVRWHSFQMEEKPNITFLKCFTKKEGGGMPVAGMSAGQLLIIRKLALVTLTGYMERYCPSHRSGWNWEFAKFIKKMKVPDYRGKKLFGVPLTLCLQRNGQPLPVAISAAFDWLRETSHDQVGIFRKSGGKSNINKLRQLVESCETPQDCKDIFQSYQSYDIADMVKQYFRELPEPLLTNKMSETFTAIFQYLPVEVRLDAVQCAILLLPDENREVLCLLLDFLVQIAQRAACNQMTSSNLGVCLAQSIFHSSLAAAASSVSASPKRMGKGAGLPNMKELAEAKASHECLCFMIDNFRQIFTVTEEKLDKCKFSYMDESKPVPLTALGEGLQFRNWRGYLYECTSATVKEGREKTRGWFNVSAINDPAVEIAYKKVGDGHPLRLWRCMTDISATPKEVLSFITTQRSAWDCNFLESRIVKKQDEYTEIFQFVLRGPMKLDFCVLRSWQLDLPRAAIAIVETSIDHADAKPLAGVVRGVVLASRYLIEPLGRGRSRVMHLARVDMKGKTPDWYNKNYGHICAHYLSRMRTAFEQRVA